MVSDTEISFREWGKACDEPHGKRQIDVNVAHAAALGGEDDEWYFWARRVSAAMHEGRYEVRH